MTICKRWLCREEIEWIYVSIWLYRYTKKRMISGEVGRDTYVILKKISGAFKETLRRELSACEHLVT